MEETVTKNHQGIPGLMSIPVLGKLFRWDFDSVEKTELIILITPHVITNKTEGSRLTNEFLDKLSEVKTLLGEKEAGGK